MSKSKYTPTKTGYKEEEDIKKTVPTKEEEEEIENLAADKAKETKKVSKVPNEENLEVPYSDLGQTVQQLSQFQEHKRKAILGPRDAEFCKKYNI